MTEPVGTDLVIVGAGGHGRELLDVVEAINSARPSLNFLGFLDDDEEAAREPLARRGGAIVGPVARLASIDASFAIGAGSGQVRRRIDALASGHRRQPASLCHPCATVGSDVRLGPGAVVAAGARITTNVSTGRHVHLNVNAIVSHDCVLGDYVTLSPGSQLSGGVVAHDGVLLGAGAVVIQGVVIGAGSVIGAGACVVRDIPPGVVAAGVPARVVRAVDGP
jgi:sugar O-acyltransferase (sialic acid O-acetyltransferase NeuD family)